MRKDNLTIIGVTAVGGAFALFVRWLQNGAIFDLETGLATPNAAVSWILVLLCAAVAVVQLVLSLRLCYRLAEAETSVSSNTAQMLNRIVRIVLSALSILGGILMLLTAFRSGQMVLMLCLAILALGTGLGMLWLSLNAAGKTPMHCLCYAVPIIFYCLWLIIAYKDNASNPVLWSYCMQILAICTGILAWFFSAGRVFDKPQPTKALFFSQFAAFLGILLLADELPLSTHLLLLCPMLFLLLSTKQFRPSTDENP